MNKRDNYDYLVLGGGTAGAVIAARLAENTAASVCLVEAGPSDEDQTRVLELRRWMDLLGSDLDYDYEISAQERGNGLIRHSRGRVLGGCSSHNSAISFRTPDVDLREWESLGAAGWGPEETSHYFDRVAERVHRETVEPENACGIAFVEAARQAGFPLVHFDEEEFREGVGWFTLNQRDGIRQSSSVAYLHPLNELPPNLTILTDTQIRKVLLDEKEMLSGPRPTGAPSTPVAKS